MAESRLAQTVSTNRRASGRTTVTLRCPFCECHTEVSVWSLAGSGKRCECGAKFSGKGIGMAEATRAATKLPTSIERIDD